MLQHHNNEMERNHSVKRILAEVVVGIEASFKEAVHQAKLEMSSYHRKTKKSMVDAHKHRKWNIPK